MSDNSKFFYYNRPESNLDERLERNIQGDTLKKYGGTETSWPTYSKVQLFGQSHKAQQDAANQVDSNIQVAWENLLK